MWLWLAGEFWATTEGGKRELVGLLRTYDDWRPMMRRHEARTWQDLPEWLPAWRGYDAGFNEDGLAYTMDREMARACPFVARYRMAGLMLVLHCVWISKEDCIIKMDQGRTEVLARIVNESNGVALDLSVSPGAFAGIPRLPATVAV
ncbi:hypothetical protein G8A07_17115 [Roseateles sp. DAIF2]|uniref:hypothetical protein n=1 Tax=Roseateles sp. DAIF2 TaxID=2714952 RepID=UPI0018A2620E|nr:hypothetical protein [Roseateles sp. DAIF2]QPF74468.1 hypothetical protein G8A07_17115 [Roseateles sp. DAIF2]